jgi:hypothetical protein
VDGKAVGWLCRYEYLAITLAPGVHGVGVFELPPALSETRPSGSITLETLAGQAHYLSVRQPQSIWRRNPTLVLMERSGVEALPALKKMKPMP